MKAQFTNHFKYLPIFIGVSIFVYLVLRIFLMPISDDEFITVDLHASQNWLNVLITGNPSIDWAPNNHVLNTLFMKLEILIFGRKDWAVRLHVIVAFIVCFYYMLKIVQYFTDSYIRQSFYLLVIFFNPYLLDFFGIARGYALSIAAFSAAFYYLILYSDQLNIKDLKLVFISLFFSIWSNMSAIYFLVLFSILLIFIIFKSRNEIGVKNHLLIIIISSLIILVINLFPLIKTLKSPDTFGGKIGIFHDTIVSYISHYIHFNEHIERHNNFTPDWKYIELYGLVFLILWIILTLTSLLFDTNFKIKKIQHYSLFLLIGSAIISKILFLWKGVPFPMDRTALLFSMPFYIGICVSFERMILKQKLYYIPLIVVISALTWHFANAVTFERTIEWWQNGDAKHLVSFMKEEFKQNPPNGKVKFGVEGWQYHSLAFYTEVEFKDQMDLIWTDLSNNERHFDYVFVPNHMKDKVWKEYEIIQTFKWCTLYKLKKPI